MHPARARKTLATNVRRCHRTGKSRAPKRKFPPSAYSTDHNIPMPLRYQIPMTIMHPNLITVATAPPGAIAPCADARGGTQTHQSLTKCRLAPRPRPRVSPRPWVALGRATGTGPGPRRKFGRRSRSRSDRNEPSRQLGRSTGSIPAR